MNKQRSLLLLLVCLVSACGMPLPDPLGEDARQDCAADHIESGVPAKAARLACDCTIDGWEKELESNKPPDLEGWPDPAKGWAARIMRECLKKAMQDNA
jgi:hypothetical protein